jgi:hypothetical protein
MARRPSRDRAAEQRGRQQKLRDDARAARRPTRDDVARMLLYQMIAGVDRHRSDRKQVLEKLCNEIVAGLESQGFDSRQSEDVFDDLVRKYSTGIFPFRRKLHFTGAGSDGQP